MPCWRFCGCVARGNDLGVRRQKEVERHTGTAAKAAGVQLLVFLSRWATFLAQADISVVSRRRSRRPNAIYRHKPPFLSCVERPANAVAFASNV
jgi:hypothetical protein